MKTLYSLTIALSAFLLFSAEPMVARIVLPALGGSSAVWITALAFFQLTLLAGYAYSAWAARASAARRSIIVAHLLLLAAAVVACFLALPFDVSLRHMSPSAPPQLSLFLLLARLVGLPFFLLSTTTPLLQSWYARREGAAVPYRLFALSNFASLLALLSYPTLVEPHLALPTQRALWSAGFVFYPLLAAALTLRMRSAGAEGAASVKAPEADPELRGRGVRTFGPGVADSLSHAGRRLLLLWFLLPAVASFQLAAVTAHLTENVAAMPLLWVLPLAAYLLSFVLAFELPTLYRRAIVIRLLAVLVAGLGYLLSKTGTGVPIGLAVLFFLAELLVAAWFLHAELFALRPISLAGRNTPRLPTFYLLLAAGGAAGTCAVAILSPLLTRSNFDLPFSFALTAAVAILLTWSDGWGQRLLWVTGTVLALALLVVVRGDSTRNTVFRDRNFYGSLRVKETHTPPEAVTARTLLHGTIQHGMQWFNEDFRHTPMTYYAEDSGVGLALNHCCDATRPRRIGVIGLGAGTVATYGRAGDQIRFFEINPLVTGIAGNLFTYTRDSPATVTTTPGDARLSLAAEPASSLYDVLVIDAFSGDAIPVHLLTREALSLFRRHLTPGGVLAFHISNQYLDLAPVLARLAESTHSSGTPLLARRIDSAAHPERGEFTATWVLMSTRVDFFPQPELAAVTAPIFTRPGVALWTDNYSSLLPILHWSGDRPAADQPADVRFVR